MGRPPWWPTACLQMEMEAPDFFLPGLTWGSLYSAVFHYADLTQNNGRYTGPNPARPDANGITTYFSEVSSKKERGLDFTFSMKTMFRDARAAMIEDGVNATMALSAVDLM